MKLAPFLILALLALSAPAHACKPAPAPKCEAKDSIPLNAPSFEELSGKVTGFQKQLSAFLENAHREKGRSSCFNSNFAIFYFSQARESAPKNEGKICSDLIQKIKKSTDALVSADSPEWKAVKDKTDQAALSASAKAVRSALEEFLHRH